MRHLEVTFQDVELQDCAQQTNLFAFGWPCVIIIILSWKIRSGAHCARSLTHALNTKGGHERPESCSKLWQHFSGFSSCHLARALVSSSSCLHCFLYMKSTCNLFFLYIPQLHRHISYERIHYCTWKFVFAFVRKRLRVVILSKEKKEKKNIIHLRKSMSFKWRLLGGKNQRSKRNQWICIKVT